MCHGEKCAMNIPKKDFNQLVVRLCIIIDNKKTVNSRINRKQLNVLTKKKNENMIQNSPRNQLILDLNYVVFRSDLVPYMQISYHTISFPILYFKAPSSTC